MNLNRVSAAIRKLLWRLGRKTYTYARGDGPNDPHVNGEYWLLEQVLNGTPGPQVLLDVGANKGDWTAHAIGLVAAPKEVHVHAFEPSLATRSMLTARFRGSAVVSVQPYALSVTVGEATFYCNDIGAGTNSLSPVSGPKEETVRLITVDEFLQHFGIESVSMVKIDTEGFDLLVLKGAEKALSEGLIQLVQFEYNWRWLLNHASLRDVFDLISNKPYRLGKLVGETIEFFKEWHFELDRYFENNYVLVRQDSELCFLGIEVHFDNSNALAFSGLSRPVR
jgi:FkbM family methyltransferase